MRNTVKYLALASLIGFSGQTPALTINPTFSGSTDSTYQGYVQTAINNITGIFTGTILSVNITFQQTTSASTLGESSYSLFSKSYSEFRTALGNTVTTAEGQLAYSNLPVQSNNPVTNDSTPISMTTANARALGFSIVGPPGQSDGTITVNTSGNNGTYDYVAVVEHEIDEILGLGSGVNTSFVYPEDLYRYDASGQRSFTTSKAAQDAAYFSVTGNVDTLTSPQFNQDGFGDYGDWCTGSSCTNSGLYVQNAYGANGAAVGSIPYSSREINALEAIGYNGASPVPLPPAAYLLASGLLCVVVRARRRKTA